MPPGQVLGKVVICVVWVTGPVQWERQPPTSHAAVAVRKSKGVMSLY